MNVTEVPTRGSLVFRLQYVRGVWDAQHWKTRIHVSPFFSQRVFLLRDTHALGTRLVPWQNIYGVHCLPFRFNRVGFRIPHSINSWHPESKVNITLNSLFGVISHENVAVYLLQKSKRALRATESKSLSAIWYWLFVFRLSRFGIYITMFLEVLSTLLQVPQAGFFQFPIFPIFSFWAPINYVYFFNKFDRSPSKELLNHV